MVCFSNDVDILKYEPMLFNDLYLPWQVIVSGNNGMLRETEFRDFETNFSSLSIDSGCVLYVYNNDTGFEGYYEVISTESTYVLSISALRSDKDSEPIKVGYVDDISYRIATLAPQAAEAGFMLTEYFGIRPGNPASKYGVEDIANPEVLKSASVYAVISGVYAMLAGRGDDDGYWKKSLYYKEMLEKAKQRCRLSFDSDGDGNVDFSRIGASIRLIRE